MKSDLAPITHLEYTKAMLSGLLNFCYRSGFADGGACPDCVKRTWTESTVGAATPVF